MGIVEQAKIFAENAHKNQKRESGEPYFNHPQAVVDILSRLSVDEPTLAAAYLHDVIEDTEIADSDIEVVFGEEILQLVLGVTRLENISNADKSEYHKANLQRMFLAMASDIRVILIKLADRLHNMRTLEHLQDNQIRKIANETLYLYAPLADRLGLAQIKWELEDLSFRQLHPIEYNTIADSLTGKRDEREADVSKAISELENYLAEYHIPAQVTGRPKHLYSIWRKIKSKTKSVDEVFDLLGLRVIVKSIEDCYRVLDVVHQEYLVVTERYKDYVAHPKPNSYQSIHTTVENESGALLEIQIRTEEMHRIAEFGVAAHWIYQQDYKPLTHKHKKTSLKLLGQIASQLDEISYEDALQNLLKDINRNDIFVFTPHGEIKRLPHQATPLDFAFSIHSEVGCRCTGAKVNGKLTPLRHQLKTGDIVEVMTSQSAEPSRDWLEIVVSGSARAKLRTYFRRENRDELIALGKQILTREAQKRNLTLNMVLNATDLDEFLSAANFSSFEDVLARIGETVLSPTVPLNFLFPPVEPIRESIPTQLPDYSGYVVVAGMDDIPIRLAKCCKPIPMAALTGYITKMGVITIHRTDCKNLKKSDSERLIDADWVVDDTLLRDITLHLEIIGDDRAVSNVIRSIESSGCTVMALVEEDKSVDSTVCLVNVRLASRQRLKELQKKLIRSKNVLLYEIL